MGLFIRKAKGEKKKKPLWRRILKWTGITFLVLLLLIIAAPFIFKGKIIRLVKEQANNNLNAVIDFDEDDVEISLLTTFPNFSITLKNFKVDGKDKFEGVNLADIKALTAKVNVWDVVGGSSIAVKKIELVEPNINVLVLEDGSANYDIAIPDTTAVEEESGDPFKFALEEYIISGGNITYDDRSLATYVNMTNLNLNGAIEIDGDAYTFISDLKSDEFTIKYDDVAYLNKTKADVQSNLVIEMPADTPMKFIFKENEIKLNNFKLDTDGNFIMADDHYDMDITFDAGKSTFKDLLSLIPTPYAVDMGDIDATGKLALNGAAKGKYSDTEIPGFDINLDIDKARIQYPDVPKAIENLNVKTNIKRSAGADLDNLILNVTSLTAAFAGNSLDASLLVKNPMSDPDLSAKLISDINLETLKEVMPMAEGESYSGTINSDINIAGRMSSIENEQYDKFNATGDLSILNMKYASADLPDPVQIDSMLFKFSPQNLDLANFKAKMGETEIHADGKIDNYIAYYFKEELLKGHFNVAVNKLDLDKLMATDGTETEETSTATVEGDTTSYGVIPIPGNIDFDLKSSLGQVIYSGLPIDNIKGDVRILDKTAELTNLSMNALGGEIILNGKYDTKNEQTPKIAMNYNLKSIDIKQASEAFVTVEKLAPIAKHCTGKISSEFSMVTDLNGNMEPVYNSISGEGNMSSNKVYIEGFEPLNKLAANLKMEKLAKQTIDNVKMSFKFAEGKIHYDESPVKLGKIKSTIGGSTSFEQDIDYKMNMFIPKSELPSSAIMAAEKAMGTAGNLGIDLGTLPNEIPVKVKMLGKVQNPKITTDLQEQLLSLSGNLTDKLKEKLNETVDSVKQEVIEKVEEKIDEVKEDVTEQVNKIMADAEKKSNQVKSEGQKAAQKIRDEADKAYDQAVAAAGNNPVKKKAAKILAQKAKDKAYKKADDTEAIANKKADDIMSAANVQADKLRNQ